MLSLVALDMAGTTIDEGGAVYASLKKTVEAVTRTTLSEEQLRSAMGANKRDAIRAFLDEFGMDSSTATVEQMYQDFRVELVSAYVAHPPKALPGVEDALARLRANGIRVALTTGFSRSIAALILDNIGWTVGEGPEHTVDLVVTADDVAAGRPAPDLVLHAMKVFGIEDPQQVLSAGDTELDLVSGTKAGARFVVAVSTGAQSVELLQTFPHTDVCDVQDLPELLGV
ncbi:phosphonatase-like hydrolase [Rhodococcus tukisamuensis]|uniref:Phosphonatase-like hydrolase n=1 Tax=Rhodococcus tukisamuensis TaxID=168276 RepID=A0A1G6WFW0_9NOCA|nr:phosphonatase-like hydrolase [Rhodococcus tukisamuensis]SDD64688.1 phosphonatase-like hydrolase [Rhodococcus tukisamuensis]